jgi:hypothetical protein
MPGDIVANLLICALECIQHLVVLQLLPQLRRNMQDSLFGKIFYEIFDEEALKRIGDDELLTIES